MLYPKMVFCLFPFSDYTFLHTGYSVAFAYHQDLFYALK